MLKCVFQEAYRNLAGDVEDPALSMMLREASDLVDRFGDESWLEWAAELMPRTAARVEREREAEAKRQADEERRIEAEALRIQRREEKDRRAAKKEKERAEREAEMGRLSPNSSRTAPRKTSQSSLASAEVEASLFASEEDFVGSQRRTRGSQKGKGKATEVAYQNPKFALPKNSELVSPTPFFLVRFVNAFLQVNNPCAQCRGFQTPFRCYVVPGKGKCVKCAHDKYPCSFEPDTKVMSTSVVVTPKATQASSSRVRIDGPSTPVASGSRVPRRPLLGK
jgi:hypothetical protein